MPFDKSLAIERLDYMFQSAVRSRLLLFVAAVGESDLTTIYKLLGMNRTSAWLAVNHWKKQRILRDRRFKTRRLISMNPMFIVAKELKSLLRAIIAATDEYHVLRIAGRKRLRNLLKEAGATYTTRSRINDRRR